MALMERVVHLRLQIRETCAKLGDNMEGALMRLTEHAGSVQPAAKRRAFLRRAAGEIEGLDIKPHRGRLRDIKRIDALLADLAKDLNALK